MLANKLREVRKKDYLETAETFFKDTITADIEKEGAVYHALLRDAKKAREGRNEYDTRLSTLRKEYANYLKTYQDELENTKALEVKKLADDSKVQVYQERIGILQAARNDHDENLKSAIAGIHDRTTSLVGMFETRMGPIDAMRKQEFMADLHDIYALDVKAYADAIRSLGNFLANYAGTGAGATLSTSVGHLSLLA